MSNIFLPCTNLRSPWLSPGSVCSISDRPQSSAASRCLCLCLSADAGLLAVPPTAPQAPPPPPTQPSPAAAYRTPPSDNPASGPSGLPLPSPRWSWDCPSWSGRWGVWRAGESADSSSKVPGHRTTAAGRFCGTPPLSSPLQRASCRWACWCSEGTVLAGSRFLCCQTSVSWASGKWSGDALSLADLWASAWGSPACFLGVILCCQRLPVVSRPGHFHGASGSTGTPPATEQTITQVILIM